MRITLKVVFIFSTGVLFSALGMAQNSVPAIPPALVPTAASELKPATAPVGADQRIYISIGDPRLKKVLLAVE